MRCFVAVETTAEAREELGRLSERLAARAPGMRRVRPGQIHLTLAFLGDVAEDFPAAAVGPLAAACAAHRAFRTRLAGLGAFPAPQRARVLWVGVTVGRDEFVGLQRSVATALEPLGYRAEPRPFSPHLTLGRLRSPADLTAAIAVDFAGTEIPVERVRLMHSELRPDGPRHTELGVFPLARPA